MKTYLTGDPLDPNTRLGPLAREDLRAKLDEQVKKSIKAGAQCHTGGAILPGNGYYYPPTLLSNVMPGMPAFDEELFGPVIAIINAADEDEAEQLANQTEYGLGAAVFTQNEKKGFDWAANKLQAGACFVNGAVASDPVAPFGGIKHSGYGRELGKEGMLEFMNTKTVAVCR